MDLDDLVKKLKYTDRYRHSSQVLDKKRFNEGQAKKIVENMPSSKNKANDLRQIFDLVDEPYTAVCGEGAGPWFAKLIKPNALKMLEESDERIARWFNIVVNKRLSAENIIDALRKGPDHIDGVSVGFTTLLLYILDRSGYSVWFRALHGGLRILCPQTEKFTGRGSQYTGFNNAVKNFARQYRFDDVEMDWVLSQVHKIV